MELHVRMSFPGPGGGSPGLHAAEEDLPAEGFAEVGSDRRRRLARRWGQARRAYPGGARLRPLPEVPNIDDLHPAAAAGPVVTINVSR